MNLEVESDVNAAELQKAPAEGTAGEPGFGEFGEKAAAANEDVTGPAADHGNFIPLAFPCPRSFPIGHLLSNCVRTRCREARRPRS